MLLENGNILDLLFADNDDDMIFDKQGKLWINRNDLLMNIGQDDPDQPSIVDDHQFNQYYCRLRGNLLFVVDSFDNKSKQQPSLNLIILSKNFTIKLCDSTTTSKSSSLLFEFCLLLNVAPKNKTTTITTTVEKYRFACDRIEDRDDWIKKIYLSSFEFLHTLHRALDEDFLLKKLKQNSNQTDHLIDDDDDDRIDQSPINFHLIIGCDNVNTLCNHSQTSPLLFLRVFLRKNQESLWKFLGQTETIQSRSPQFVNSIRMLDFQQQEIQLKFELYSVIESYFRIELFLAYAFDQIHQVSKQSINVINEVNLTNLKTRKFVGHLKYQIIIDRQNDNDGYLNDLSVNNHFQQRPQLDSIEMSGKLEKSGEFRMEKEHPDLGNIPETLFNQPPITRRLCFNPYDQSNLSKIIVEEFMQDSSFVFIIPLILLKSFTKDEDFILKIICEQKQSLSRCNFYEKLLNFHLETKKLLEKIIQDISTFKLTHTFRPSKMKKDLFIQFIPINLHRQLFHVEFNGKSSNQLRIYTVGAFACHHYGFDKFNWKNFAGTTAATQTTNVDEIWKLFRKLWKISHNEQKIFECLDNLDNYFNNNDDDNLSKIKLLYEKIHRWSEELIDLIDTNDLDQMMNNNNDNDLRNYLEELHLEPIDLIYLNIKACFVDIDDKIQRYQTTKTTKFINEFEPCNRKLRNAIGSLKRTIFVCYISAFARIVTGSTKDNHLESFRQIKFRWLSLLCQSLTAVIIFIEDQILDEKICLDFLTNINRTGNILILFEALLSCFSEETGMLEDMLFALDTISNITHITFCFDGDQMTNSGTKMIPKIDFNSDKIHLLFHIDPVKIAETKKFERIIECRLLPLIFNVGVNHQASLPNNIFKKSLQEELNESSFKKLKSFIEEFYPTNNHCRQLLSDLETELKRFKSKNIRILELSNEICRQFDGNIIKTTCCKSAKDRTGMSVTLEEVRFVFKFLNFQKDLHQHLFQTMLDTIRRDGTRIENVRKNIGAKKYAFNYFGLLTFPQEFRPPWGTYSNVDT